MSVPRETPSAAWLIKSKRDNNVPAAWDWAWCSNEECPQIVWYDPGAREASAGLAFLPVCSAACSLACIAKLP